MLAFKDLVFAADNDSRSSVQQLRSDAERAFSKGNSDESLKLWAQVIALEPANGDHYYKRFRVHLDKLMLTEAKADLDYTIKNNPTNRNALEDRSKLIDLMRRFDEADRGFAARKM